ncbi:hypothetical protein GCM10010967_09580 [Dyadobacter beijingensis]|uniref:Transposase n=1 Tax=Dyadobacter beijingensis TaxID=365489 RepID=A0ABQ2HGX0_9BACT|nr:hypothetical protein GCM10010967_09580 [Dyadobacter beijingensis]
MKETKPLEETKKFKLSPAQQQFVDQKLKDANEYLRTADLSALFADRTKTDKTKKV